MEVIKEGRPDVFVVHFHVFPDFCTWSPPNVYDGAGVGDAVQEDPRDAVGFGRWLRVGIENSFGSVT